MTPTDPVAFISDWIAQVGIPAGLLIYVLVRLDQRIGAMTDTLDRFIAWEMGRAGIPRTDGQEPIGHPV